MSIEEAVQALRSNITGAVQLLQAEADMATQAAVGRVAAAAALQVHTEEDSG